MTLGLESLGSVGAYAVRPDILLGPDGPIRDAVMTVENGRIAAIEPACRRDETIDSGIPALRLENRAIVPGFIDTHHHVTEPFAKAIACGEPAQMWKRIWMPLEEATSPETAYIAAKWTFFEALRGGFTTVVDHGIRGAEHTDAIQRAAEETGVRLVSSTGVYDLSDFDTDARKPAAASTVDDALRTADDHVARTARRNNVTPSLACGTVQSNSGEMIKCLSDYCAERGMVFQIHANEHTPEVHRCIEREGCRPIEYLNRIGALGPTTLIAHATLVTGDEIAMLRETDTAVSYNPVASQWKGNGVAPALDYARRGIRFGLGTDATRNDAFRLLDAAEACQRLAYGMPNDDFSCGAGWVWLDAATGGGARAAGLGAVTGALEPGLAADFLVLEMESPEVLPSWDFTWELVRYYDRANIVATVVAGRPATIGGEPVGASIAAFTQEYLETGVRSVDDADIVRLHGPSDSHRP